MTTEFVSVKMLAEHAKRRVNAIYRAMKAAGVKAEKFPGVQGLRIPKQVANKFLAKHWPEVGPMR